MAVHARPAAFEGLDGASYSADIITDTTDDESAQWGAYLFFVQWGRGEPEAVGHLETGFLVRGTSEAAVKRAAGQMSLLVVKATLDGLIRAREAGSPSGSDAPPPAHNTTVPSTSRLSNPTQRPDDRE